MTLQILLLKIIDFLYKPFRKLIPSQLFKYGISGGANMILDWILYFVFYNFIFRHQNVCLGFVTISPHIASFIVVFPITLLTGFWLAKYISFTESALRGRTQLIRYIFVVVMNIAINYGCLKLFVEICHIYPTPSKMITTIITVAFSFFMQKFFTFKV